MPEVAGWRAARAGRPALPGAGKVFAPGQVNGDG
jgi:hypothetical protein